MDRVRLWTAVLVAGVLVLGTFSVWAQEAGPRIVQGSDGSLYLLQGGGRYAIAIDGIGDEELAGYEDAGTLGSAELVALLAAGRQPTAVRQQPPAPEQAAPAPPTEAEQPPQEGGEAGGIPARGGSQQTPTPREQLQGPRFTSVQGAQPGGTAMVSVQAPAGATCSIAYRTPAGAASTADGLGQQTVPANGTATWSFMIGSNTQPGIGSITVTCGNTTINTTIQIGSGGLTR